MIQTITIISQGNTITYDLGLCKCCGAHFGISDSPYLLEFACFGEIEQTPCPHYGDSKRDCSKCFASEELRESYKLQKELFILLIEDKLRKLSQGESFAIPLNNGAVLIEVLLEFSKKPQIEMQIQEIKENNKKVVFLMNRVRSAVSA